MTGSFRRHGNGQIDAIMVVTTKGTIVSQIALGAPAVSAAVESNSWMTIEKVMTNTSEISSRTNEGALS